jgi:1-phosphofructokinase
LVYTVTFNPALDYVMNLNSLTTDDINRTESEELYYGGKGINVSAVLSRLKVPTSALGFSAGFTGKKLKEMLDADGIKNDFTELEEGHTRINVKVKYGKELDINAGGPQIPPEKVELLLEKLEKLQSGDFLVLAGSVPSQLPDDLYSRILKNLSGRGIHFVVDTTGNQLLNVLKYKPFLIKPNHHELGEIFGEEMNSTSKIAEYAVKLKEMGAVNVLVSRGGDGALLVDENSKVYPVDAVKGKLVNSVGCGDSMVAGFIAGYIFYGDYEKALKLSVASSAATAFSKELAQADEIKEIYNKL